ncbi:MAG: hypothetical protein HQL29_06240, partial [Candidatus Omnitrophica bacterium]|nr:hypothetical protein [Candidatus Omnitrophota bacterium]
DVKKELLEKAAAIKDQESFIIEKSDGTRLIVTCSASRKKKDLAAVTGNNVVLKIWSGYAGSDEQKRLMQEIRDIVARRGYTVDFGNISDEAISVKELVDFAVSSEGKKDNTVTIIPADDPYAREHMNELKGSNVIFMDVKKRVSGETMFFRLEAIMAAGLAYINNDELIFANLYRILTGDDDTAISLAMIKSDPFVLQFILDPISLSDVEIFRSLNERMREMLMAA